MKIIVDAFGGDNAPLEIMKGCADAVAEYGIDVMLVGPQEEIKKTAREHDISLNRMEIVHAPQVLTMEDHPGEVMKSKKDCSMAEGLRRLAAGEGDAFVSAGNSGALVVGARLIVKRIKGIQRVGFAPIMPKSDGCFMLIDSGANVQCRAEQLQQFGVMGSIYMERVMKMKNPRVGLANVGTEEHKGDDLRHEAYALLKQSPINFIGNIEARDIPVDAADVVVADGFSGNLILKLYEGVAMTLMGKMKDILTKNAKTKIAAALILPDMKELKKQMDYNEYGGAPIMGISKPVFKAHGNAKAKTFKNAMRLTIDYVKGNVTQEIAQAVSERKPSARTDGDDE